MMIYKKLVTICLLFVCTVCVAQSEVAYGVLYADEGEYVFPVSDWAADSSALAAKLPAWHWQRDSNHCIVGNWYRLQTEDVLAQPIRLSYKPDIPYFRVDTVLTNDALHLTIHYYAKGATEYRVTYCGHQDMVSHTETMSATTLNHTLSNLNPYQQYSVYVTAINNSGVNESNSYVIGEAGATLIMRGYRLGNNLYYLFTCGNQNVTDLNIVSVLITNLSGVWEMSSNAGINEAIDISSLSVGYHYLVVTLQDGRSFSARFRKS